MSKLAKGSADKSAKLPGTVIFNLCLFGLMGQIAWNVENMYFNTFLYNSVYAVSDQGIIDSVIPAQTAINIMVAASSVTAVLTSLLMGALSDKLGRRKVFISVGYILWGIVTASFGLISRDNVASLFNISDGTKILTVTVWLVIGMDCLMTFMGSTSNDAAFNAWVTDVSNEKNRATTESILAIMPIGAMGIVLGLGAAITKVGYPVFFIVLGGIVTVCGIAGIFTLRDSLDGKVKNESYLGDLLYGFKPSVIKKNSRLYTALAAVCVFSVAVNTFFPYLIIYIQHGFETPEAVEQGASSPLEGIEFTPGLIAGLAVAAVLLISLVVFAIIFVGKMIDKHGKDRFVFIAAALFVAGLFAAALAKNLIAFIICAVPALIGYGMLGIMLNATVRDFTPEDKTGLFQGVRMVFFVLIPMCVGPTLGNISTMGSTSTYINDYGVTMACPSGAMFIAAAAVSLLLFIPLAVLKKKGFSPSDNA